MRLTVRHLTGSRAGQQQTFDTNEVSIGRHPSSMILFDPEKDRVVSGKHASLVNEQNGWIVRDLGSSNGTFVGGESVRERVLRPGDIVQLGKNGPQVQVEFESDEVAATVVVPLDDLRAPQAPREGKTLIMMMPGADSAAAPAGAAYVAPAPRKKGGTGRALAIVAAALIVLLVGAAALAFAVRNANMKKKKQVASAATSTATTTAATSTAAQAEAERINQQIAQQQQQIAQTQATLDKTQTQGGATNQEAEDLKRQLAESQAMLEQMTRELQQKNDQMSSSSTQKAARPEIRYVPASTPRTPTAQRSTPRPAAQETFTPGTTASKTQPASQGAGASAVAQPSIQLFTGKRLKKKVLITPLPSEVQPAGLPSSTPRDLANLLTSALVSTGDYVVGPRGQASVSVMVTNYRADIKKGIDTKRTADSARKLGKIFGQNVPGNPVDVRSVAYDASMSVRVKLYDPSGRVLAEVEPSAASQDRKTKTALGGVSFHDIALSDTAAGDVARKVIGDAIDTVRNGLSNLEWTTTVQGAGKEKLQLASGRNANLEPGDVFDVMDGNKAITRVRITSVTETASEAEYLTPPPAKAKLNGKTARYQGSDHAVSSSQRDRSLVVRIKTPAYDGPGDSFNSIRPLKVGQRLRFHYSVGAWARASDGGSSFWVPLAKVQVNS